jgi:hypothetical protein
MRPQLLFALLAGLWLLGSGCATPSTYRSSSLHINAVPNRLSTELAATKAPKVEEELNRAFIADGRFAQGNGLVLSVEIKSFQAPRSSGTQAYFEQPAESYRFLPGILVVGVRWYDDRQQKLEEAEYASNIMPLPGEVSTYSSIVRAIEDATRRIADYTTDRYLGSKASPAPVAQ